jgi:hypothetical protein
VAVVCGERVTQYTTPKREQKREDSPGSPDVAGAFRLSYNGTRSHFGPGFPADLQLDGCRMRTGQNTCKPTEYALCGFPPLVHSAHRPMAISRCQFFGLSAAGAATLAVRPSIAAGGPEGWEEGSSLPWPTQEVYCTTWNGRTNLCHWRQYRRGHWRCHFFRCRNPRSFRELTVPLFPSGTHHS